MSKRIISIILVLSILPISVFASHDGSIIIGTASSGNLEVIEPPPDINTNAAPPAPANPTAFSETLAAVSAIYTLFAGLYQLIKGDDNKKNGWSDYFFGILFNTNELVNWWASSNGTISRYIYGLFHNSWRADNTWFYELVKPSTGTSDINLWDIWNRLGTSGSLWSKLNDINNNLLTTSGASITIRNLLQSYIGDIHSDVLGLNRMFSSVNGGGAYYNLFASPNSPLRSMFVDIDNISAGVSNENTYLSNIDSKLGASGTIGGPIEEINTNTYFIRYLRQILLGTYDYSTGESNLINDILNKLRDIDNSSGYNSNSTLADTLDDIADKEDSQITELQNIVDVLANQNDQTIVNNQTDNKTTVIPIFFAPSNTNNTSLNTTDFTNLGGIVRAIRNLLDTGISLAGFSAALDEAADEGLDFFQQSTIDDMYNSDYLGAYS